MPCHSCVKLMKRDNACVNVNCVKNMYVVLLLAQCRITDGHLQLQISGNVLEYTANVWICTSIDIYGPVQEWSYRQSSSTKDPTLLMSGLIAKNLNMATNCYQYL